MAPGIPHNTQISQAEVSFLGYAHTFSDLLYFPAVFIAKVSLHQSTPTLSTILQTINQLDEPLPAGSLQVKEGQCLPNLQPF